MTCQRCGQTNPEGFRFCGACGAPLEQGLPPREVRKEVTVLFSDVVGSTPLGERLDPESLRRVMARWFEAARTVLDRHDGSVEKFIGDAVMAVFGVPHVHEDDALRAVRAAWELRDALSDLNHELGRDYGVRIEVRTGINTGEVVAGTEERLATGDAVNVAARLEQLAAPGEVLIGEVTYRLVRDAVQAEPIEQIALKGKTDASKIMRLLAVQPSRPGVARRLDSPLVGRGRERSLLHDAFERVARDHACQLFTILGAAGVGKSRLVEEFLHEVDGSASVVRGRCLPYGEGITYWPIGEIVRELPSASELFEDVEEGRLVAERLRPALGSDEMLGRSEEIAWAVRKLFEALAVERPLVVLLDDIHWAEPTFLDLIDHVADWSREAPILLVCVARPELLDSRRGWAGGKLNATSVLLEPLDEDEADTLIENLLGRATLDDGVRTRITEAAEGNPLFVEEMLGMVIDEGLLARSNGSWVPRGDLASVTVPPTIRALLAARIDNLGPGERSVLECGAVEGKEFHRGAVAHLAPGALRDEIHEHLMSLVRKELIRPQRGELPGEDGFRFRHLLIRDAAYEALSKEARATLHERFADWLEAHARPATVEYEEIVGYHLEQAYRYRDELGPIDAAARSTGRRAAERLCAAGRRAFARLDLPAAINLLERAAALLGRTDPVRLELVPDLGVALTQTGRLPEAQAVLSDAIDAARETGDRRIELLARLHLAYTRSITGELYEAAAQEAKEAIAEFEQMGDDAGLARAWHLAGLYEIWAGRSRVAEEDWERAIAHAVAAGDDWQKTESVPWLTGAAFFGPRAAPEVRRRIEDVLRLYAGDWKVEAWSCATLAGVASMQGRFDEARAFRDRAKKLFDDLGLLLEQTWAAHFFGWLEMLAGDLPAAEAELLHGCEVSEQVGDTGYLSSTLAILADVVSEEGRHEEALKLSERAEEAGSPDDVMTHVLLRVARAKALARVGRLEEGEQVAREAVSRSRPTDDINALANSLSALGEALRLAGREEEACDALTEAVELYERKGNVVMARRLRRAVERLGH